MAKKRYYGNTIKFYQQKYPSLSKKQLGILRLCFINNWRVLARDPLCGSWIVFYETLRVYSWMACIN